MQKHSTSPFVFWSITLLSISSAWLITGNNFPYTGLSIIFISVSTLFYFLKKTKTIFHTGIYISSVLFSIFLILRADPFLNFLDITAIIILNCLLVDNTSIYTFARLLASPFKNLGAFFSTPNQFTHGGTLKNSHVETLKRINYIQVFVSILVTIVLLVFIIPLLGSANPLFDKLIKNLVNALNLDKLFQEIYVIRLILSVVFFVIISRLASYIHIQERPVSQELTSFIKDAVLVLPKIIVAIVIFVFAITQFQLYFASDELLKSLNYTNARLTQEVFTQLSIVSIIVFLLIYNWGNKSKLSQVFDYILIVEGLLLAFVGLKSDYDYSQIFGFTQKRLYGFAIIFWVFGTYVLYVVNHIRKRKPSVFVSSFILFSSLTLILINIANFDSLIYHHRRAIKGKVDYRYMSTLSADGGQYKDAAISFQTKTKKYGNDMEKWPKNDGFKSYIVIDLHNLQDKYKKIDLRTFNLSEYNAYRQIKDISLPKFAKSSTPFLSTGRINTQFTDAIASAGQLHDDGRETEALKKALEALSHAKTDKEKAKAHDWIGFLNYRLQNPSIAESETQLAIKLDPTLSGPYLNLSYIEMDRQNYQKALEYAQKCVERDPSDGWCENSVGLNLINLGRREEGIKHLEKAVSLDPDVSTIRQNLSKFKNS